MRKIGWIITLGQGCIGSGNVLCHPKLTGAFEDMPEGCSWLGASALG